MFIRLFKIQKVEEVATLSFNNKCNLKTQLLLSTNNLITAHQNFFVSTDFLNLFKNNKNTYEYENNKNNITYRTINFFMKPEFLTELKVYYFRL